MGDEKKAQSPMTGSAGQKPSAESGQKSAPPRIAAKEARTREERLVYSADRSGVGFWEMDLIDRSVTRTLQHARIFGYDSIDSEWSYERFVEHVLPEDREGLKRAQEEAAAKQADWQYECRITRCDGEVRWIAVSGGHVVERTGRASRLVGSVRDITEQVKTEQSLRESEERYRLLAEHGSDIIWLFDLEANRFTYVSPSVERLRGYSVEEVEGQSMAEALVPEDYQRVMEQLPVRIQAYLAGDESALTGTYEVSQTRKDGSVLLTEVATTLIADDGCGVTHILGVTRDITERKREDEALRESEQQFRTTVELAPEAVYVRQGDRLVYLNPAAVSLFGAADADELLGSSAIARFAPEERETTLERMRKVDTDGVETIGLNRTLMRLDGTQVHCICSALPFNYRGEPSALVFMQDVSSLRGALEELRGSEERFQVLLEAAPDGIVVLSGANAAYANRAMAALLGWEDAESLVGLEWLPLVAPGSREAMLEMTRADLQVGAHAPAFDVDLLRRDGSTVAVEVDSVITSFRGERAALVFARDWTERRKAEAERSALQEQLFQAQKMESVGMLAGGVAHDYNNILTVQRGYCELLKAQLHREDPLFKNVEEIETCIERAITLTRQLLAFSRKQELRPLTLDLNGLIDNLVGMLYRLIGEDVELVTKGAPVPAVVVADPGQIEQVLVNLSVNARDAMPRGGRLGIEVSLVEAEDIGPRCPRCGELIPIGRYVMFKVSDTGEGMDSETLSKAFEPFFTTKGEGKGTGLGLSTVYGIINQSHGHVWVDSEIGQGTTFSVILPYAGTEVTTQIRVDADLEVGAVRAVGALTVLVVEDDPALRELVSSMLEQLDHKVAAAADGQEAVSLVRIKGIRPDVVLTDLVLPDINGRTLFDQLRASVPDARVIYMSGYADDTIIGGGFLRPGVSFLHKPFDLAGLSAKVREAVNY
jgi:two-component system cell cycle sensor histidine kinase/response regulator CckA